MQAYTLDPAGADPLLSLPESGPGYQVVYLPQGHHGGAGGDYIAFGADLLIRFDEYMRFLTGSDPQNPPRSFASLAAFKASIVPPLTAIPALPSAPAPASPPTPWPVSPTLVRSVTLTSPRTLWRVSALNPDPRLRHGIVSPGTYLTSDDDLPLVTTGFGAVGRYALPTPFPASHLFRCDVPSGEILLIGTTRPNFGQAGGGVEVLANKIATMIPATFVRTLSDW